MPPVVASSASSAAAGGGPAAVPLATALTLSITALPHADGLVHPRVMFPGALLPVVSCSSEEPPLVLVALNPLLKFLGYAKPAAAASKFDASLTKWVNDPECPFHLDIDRCKATLCPKLRVEPAPAAAGTATAAAARADSSSSKSSGDSSAVAAATSPATSVGTGASASASASGSSRESRYVSRQGFKAMLKVLHEWEPSKQPLATVAQKDVRKCISAELFEQDHSAVASLAQAPAPAAVAVVAEAKPAKSEAERKKNKRKTPPSSSDALVSPPSTPAVARSRRSRGEATKEVEESSLVAAAAAVPAPQSSAAQRSRRADERKQRLLAQAQAEAIEAASKADLLMPPPYESLHSMDESKDAAAASAPSSVAVRSSGAILSPASSAQVAAGKSVPLLPPMPTSLLPMRLPPHLASRLPAPNTVLRGAVIGSASTSGASAAAAAASSSSSAAAAAASAASAAMSSSSSSSPPPLAACFAPDRWTPEAQAADPDKTRQLLATIAYLQSLLPQSSTTAAVAPTGSATKKEETSGAAAAAASSVTKTEALFMSKIETELAAATPMDESVTAPAAAAAASASSSAAAAAAPASTPSKRTTRSADAPASTAAAASATPAAKRARTQPPASQAAQSFEGGSRHTAASSRGAHCWVELRPSAMQVAFCLQPGLVVAESEQEDSSDDEEKE